MRQVRLAATLKATGLNILRAMTFKNRLRREENRKARSNPSLHSLIGVVKEQILRLRDYIEELSEGFHPVNNRSARFAYQAA
jgi:hypothetical protein